MINCIRAAYEKYCERRFPLPSVEQVVALEDDLAVRLPAGFREYVLTFNGGFFNRPEFQTSASDCTEDALDVVYGLGIRALTSEPNDAPSVYYGSELGQYVDNFTNNHPCVVLPIGYTSMGNMLLLGTHRDDAGTIYLKKAWAEEYSVLAETVEGFFSLLSDPAT